MGRAVKDKQKLCLSSASFRMILLRINNYVKIYIYIFLKYHFTLETFYKYRKQPKQLMLTKAPTKRNADIW